MYNDKSDLRKKLKKYVSLYGTVKMIDFLMKYVGIDSQLKNLENATHKDVRVFHFNDVVAVPFETLDNDDLALGNILLVVDCKHHIGAYKNPVRMQKNAKNRILNNKKIIKKGGGIL